MIMFTLTLPLSIRYCAIDFTRASKKYHEYWNTKVYILTNDKYNSEQAFWDQRVLNQSGVFSTLRSLLLVRKSVEGFKMDVMALASSSCTVLLLLVE